MTFPAKYQKFGIFCFVLLKVNRTDKNAETKSKNCPILPTDSIFSRNNFYQGYRGFRSGSVPTLTSVNYHRPFRRSDLVKIEQPLDRKPAGQIDCVEVSQFHQAFLQKGSGSDTVYLSRFSESIQQSETGKDFRRL